MDATIFQDRRHAGRELAHLLVAYADRHEVRVLALPRGGVPVGFEAARALHVPLDAFIVRKLGAPGHEEYAMGALAASGVCMLDEQVVRGLGVSKAALAAALRAGERELQRREHLYRDNRPAPEVRGFTVIVVDDGLATGWTMRAALQALKARQPARLVVAVPTAAARPCEDLRSEADEVICATTPQPFHAVGRWYQDFSQTSDDEVRELLARARHTV
jgi:putative phosphoribosyl transferase